MAVVHDNGISRGDPGIGGQDEPKRVVAALWHERVVGVPVGIQGARELRHPVHCVDRHRQRVDAQVVEVLGALQHNVGLPGHLDRIPGGNSQVRRPCDGVDDLQVVPGLCGSAQAQRVAARVELVRCRGHNPRHAPLQGQNVAHRLTGEHVAVARAIAVGPTEHVRDADVGRVIVGGGQLDAVRRDDRHVRKVEHPARRLVRELEIPGGLVQHLDEGVVGRQARVDRPELEVLDVPHGLKLAVPVSRLHDLKAEGEAVGHRGQVLPPDPDVHFAARVPLEVRVPVPLHERVSGVYDVDLEDPRRVDGDLRVTAVPTRIHRGQEAVGPDCKLPVRLFVPATERGGAVGAKHTRRAVHHGVDLTRRQVPCGSGLLRLDEHGDRIPARGGVVRGPRTGRGDLTRRGSPEAR